MGHVDVIVHIFRHETMLFLIPCRVEYALVNKVFICFFRPSMFLQCRSELIDCGIRVTLPEGGESIMKVESVSAH